MLQQAERPVQPQGNTSRQQQVTRASNQTETVKAKQETLRYLLGIKEFPAHPLIQRALTYFVATPEQWIARARYEAEWRRQANDEQIKRLDPQNSQYQRWRHVHHRTPVDRLRFGNELALLLRGCIHVYIPASLEAVEIHKPSAPPSGVRVTVEDRLYMTLMALPFAEQPILLSLFGKKGRTIGFKLAMREEVALQLYQIQYKNVDCGVHRWVLENFRQLIRSVTT